MENSKYRICTKTVMDSSDPDITFDEEGISNYYYEYYDKVDKRIEKGEAATAKLQQLIKDIKTAGKNKEYDCIVGVSGGVDSTYVAFKCKEYGLRPLAVHFDNGWNSELAVSNIEKVLQKLEIDLYTYVIDWEEFRDLQLSFLKASTPDMEVPTDHAIFALLMQVADKHGVKYIMNGMNFSTESIMPPSWAYGHSDWKYIRSVQKILGSKKLKHFPHYSFTYLFYILFIKKIRFISILNYMDYDKEKAIAVLENDLGWRYYGGKHHESFYTKFIQSYILPLKFNIDKRKAHYSSILLAGNSKISREDVLELLKKPPYDESQIQNDVEYLVKKLNITEAEFDRIMKLPVKSCKDYPNNYTLFKSIKNIQTYLRKIGIIHK